MAAEPLVLAHEVHAPDRERAVVLLHSLALDRRVWDAFVGPLSERRAVVTVDLRGHGDSPDDDDFTVEQMADDVDRTLSELGRQRVAVVGMSLGGCVAQAVALRHPERVEALGLIDTTAWYGPTAARDWEERAAKAATEGLASLAEFQLTRWFTDDFRQRHPDTCRDLLEVFSANDVKSYVATCRALGAFDAREALAGVDVPTVIVVGEHDPATPPAHSADLQSRIPGAVMHVVPDTKHLTAVERPDDIVRHLGGLLT